MALQDSAVRRAAKKDTTHNPIRDLLCENGWSVLDLSRAGDGIPDMAVGKPGFCALVEAKTGAATLNEDQRKVKARFTGPMIVANSPEDALTQLESLYATSCRS